MVRRNDDQRLVIQSRLFEELHQVADAEIHPGDALVVLGEFSAALDGVRQEVRNDHVFGIIKHFGDPRDAAAVGLVAKGIGSSFDVQLGASTMWVGAGDVGDEGFVVLGCDELAGVLHQFAGIAPLLRHHHVIGEDLSGGDVVLAKDACAVAGSFHDLRQGQGDDIGVAGEVAGVVLVAILAVGMVVQTRHHHGAAGAATGRGGIGIGEDRAVCRKCVDVGRLDGLVPIAAQLRAHIVGDEEDDVLLGSG
nr:hypothetical protein [Verrucomicrobium spinosum]